MNTPDIAAQSHAKPSDADLKAVEEDADWQLIKRTDGGVWKTLKARDLWSWPR